MVRATPPFAVLCGAEPLAGLAAAAAAGAKVSAASARLTTAGRRRRERERRPVGIMLITFLSVAGGCEQPAAQAREPRRARNEPASSPRRDPAQPQAEPRPVSGSAGNVVQNLNLSPAAAEQRLVGMDTTYGQFCPVALGAEVMSIRAHARSAPRPGACGRMWTGRDSSSGSRCRPASSAIPASPG